MHNVPDSIAEYDEEIKRVHVRHREALMHQDSRKVRACYTRIVDLKTARGKMLGRVLRECGALATMAMNGRKWDRSEARKTKINRYRTALARNADAVYRRNADSGTLALSGAIQLYSRWVSPWPPTVDATSLAGAAELTALPAVKWPEPSPLPPIPGLRFISDGEEFLARQKKVFDDAFNKTLDEFVVKYRLSAVQAAAFEAFARAMRE